MIAALENQEELGRKLHCFGSASVSLWIRIQLYTSMRIQIQGATPMRIRIQILVRLCHHKEIEFDMKNIKYKICRKTYLRKYKIHFKCWKSGGFANFGQFPCSWFRIRIRIPNTDPDPYSQYGSKSGSRRAKSMRIHADPEGSKTLPNTCLSPVCKYMACGQF